MAMQEFTKINSKLTFLYRKKQVSVERLKEVFMQCSGFYVMHLFSHTSTTRVRFYKLQVLKHKCIPFCLQLDNREHIGTEHFDKINWLLLDQIFKQCLFTSVCKFSSEVCPQYCISIFK